MTAELQMSAEELLAVFIAREMRDFETCACGAQSFIPAAGMLLGRELHAPNMEIIIRGTRHYNPIVEPRDFHFLAQRGKMDLFFIGAIEIDKHANFNLHVIGDRDAPQVLMPGQYGTGLLYYAVPRIIMFRTAHTKRIFVERGIIRNTTGSRSKAARFNHTVSPLETGRSSCLSRPAQRCESS